LLTPLQVFNLYLSKNKDFSRKIYDISGEVPKSPFLYKLALTHSSALKNPNEVQSARQSNERLEYLGDSILDAVIAEYLFKIYPQRDEGFLTEMRSKIVNRKSLNQLCKQIKLDSLIIHSQGKYANSSMYGDALEAFIGALFLDMGFKGAKRMIHRRIINLLNLNKIEKKIISYKNKLIEHIQKNKMGTVTFEVIGEKTAPGKGGAKIFQVKVCVNDTDLGRGEGKSKKEAEQKAAADALVRMRLIEPGS